MEANCYSGRCDTAFIIGFNYNEKLSSSFACTFGLNMCVHLQLVIYLLMAFFVAKWNKMEVSGLEHTEVVLMSAHL